MNRQIVIKSAGCRMNKILSVILSVMAAVAGVPTSATVSHPGTDVPTNFHIKNAGGLFRMDLSEFLRNHEAVMDGCGEMSMAIYKAVFPGTGPQDGDGAIFLFGDRPSPEDVVVLGPGQGASAVYEWREVVAVEVAGSVDAIRTTIRIGEDTLTAIYPREMFAGTMDDLPERDLPPVVVMVNGIIAEMDAAELMNIVLALADGGLIPDVSDAAELIHLIDAFRDERRFVNGYLGLGAILSSLVDALSQGNEPNTCVFKCMSCAATLVLYGVTVGTLIAACGPTLGLGCVLAILGHGATAGLVISSCGSCFDCISHEPHAGYPVPDRRTGGPVPAY